MTRARWAVAGVAAVVVLAAVVLVGLKFLGSENPRRSGTNAAFPDSVVARLAPGRGFCQTARVPETTGAIEVAVGNPETAKRTSARLRLLDRRGRPAAATRPAGVRARALRFELDRPLRRDVVGRVCVDQQGGPPTPVLGSYARRGLRGGLRARPAAVTLTYYRPGKESLLAMAPVIAHRIGLTRGHFGGTWRAIAVVLLLGAALALAAWLLVGLARGRLPRRLAWLCAAVAVLNSLAWGLIVPTFQIPDEPFHLSYVQDLAEHGKPPERRGPTDRYSDELGFIVTGSALVDINFDPAGRPHWSDEQDRELDAALARKPSTDNPGAIGSLKDYPPLYYAALIPVYAATHAVGGSTLDALTLLRALDGLLAGAAVLALFAFLAELFPRRPGLVAGASLICAFQPVFTWIQGGVNPDALLIPLGAAFFWLFARAWRRGLDRRVAIGLGLVFAASVLTKLSALGLAPGFAAGLAWLAWRDHRAGRGGLGAGAAGLVAGVVPLVLYALLNTIVWDRPLVPGGVTEAAGAPAAPAGGGGGGAHHVSGFVTYLWQYFLPPVGSMTDFFNLGWLPRDFWTPMWVGRFGWFDYQFPVAVSHAAFVLYAVIAVAAVVALVRWHRPAWALLLLFAVIAGGLLGAIARAGYHVRTTGQTIFEQARYLMPLLALYVGALALSVSLLKRRAEVAAVWLLTGAAALNLLGAFILTVRRYYL